MTNIATAMHLFYSTFVRLQAKQIQHHGNSPCVVQLPITILLSIGKAVRLAKNFSLQFPPTAWGEQKGGSFFAEPGSAQHSLPRTKTSLRVTRPESDRVSPRGRGDEGGWLRARASHGVVILDTERSSGPRARASHGVVILDTERSSGPRARASHGVVILDTERSSGPRARASRISILFPHPSTFILSVVGLPISAEMLII
jgi:hypothetical protein